MRIEVGEIFKPNWLMDLSNTPAISFMFSRSRLSSSLFGDFLREHIGPVSIFPEGAVSECAYVPSAARSEFYLPISPGLPFATVAGNSTDSCAVCCRSLFGEVLMSEF